MITKDRFPVPEWRTVVPVLIQAYFELNQLKLLYRQGWLRRGIPADRCESVAEHVFGMAMLGWWICQQNFPLLDQERVLRMTLVHELGEIYAGDLVPADGVSPQEKHRRERESVEKVVEKLVGGDEMLDLWEEFEAGETPEARFVRQLDRLEMALQARVYQSAGAENLDEFYVTADQALDDPAMRAILEALR